ncbi:unnamed protein product [Adineta steineri]|uniref:Uncharacterized protein n=1 Tax=Adineta steineri TaxID=433720 RepID=A0A814UK10_9BILA|nr:unnamed protein product [Adineta steineri]CAF1175460.1 unnamed protein product [Adineta steineri]
MALFLYTISALLLLIPADVHDKTKEIYNRIPGTLLKFFDPKTIARKVECSEHDLINEKSIESDNNEEWKKDGHEVKKETVCSSNVLCTERGIENEHNKDYNNLRGHLRKSLRQMFRNDKTIEISTDDVAQAIATKCFKECPDWGKENKYSSVILRFDSSYVTNNDSVKTNIQVYVYAHLIFECKMSFFKGGQCKTSYDLTIELSGISIDPLKISEFSLFVAKNSVSDSIKAIETNVPLTWEDLDDTGSRQASTPKPVLTRNDLDDTGSTQASTLKSTLTREDLDDTGSRQASTPKSTLAWDDL